MLKEFAREIFIDVILNGQLQGHGQHVEREHRHPACAVCLFDDSSGGQRGAAVKDANVVQSQKAALEHVIAKGILAVNPPGKIHEQLMKLSLQESAVPFAPERFLDQVN